QDKGGQFANNGEILVNILMPAAATASTGITTPTNCPTTQSGTAASAGQGLSLQELLKTEALSDPAAARAGVESGKYAAAVIIPADFTANMTYSPNADIKPTQIEVYGDPKRPIAAGIVRRIVEGIVTGITTGNVALASTLDTVTQQYGALRL